MKKVTRIACAMVILVLTSCSDGIPDLGFSFPSFDDKAQEGFYETLADEYTNLAIYEQDYRASDRNGDHFAAKARKALRHQDVEPDRVKDRNIPDFARPELTEARQSLVDALVIKRSRDNDALLAMAQTRFDCWLALREALPQKDAWISCKDSFYAAMAELKMTQPQEKAAEEQGGTYSIYFDVASTELNEDSRRIIQDIGAKYADRPQWGVYLKGFTDSKGSKSANQVLSMRRAIAVKNLLAQQGVALDNIAIAAEGETVAESGGDGSQSRRVDIVIEKDSALPKESPALPGWQHSGEF